MYKYIPIVAAVLFTTAGCEIDRQESVGEEMREAGNAIDDGAAALEEEAEDVGQAMKNDRAEAELRFDRTTREIGDWFEKRSQELEEAGDHATEETKTAVRDIGDELDEVRDDIKRAGNAADDDWDRARADIDRELEELKKKVDEFHE